MLNVSGSVPKKPVELQLKAKGERNNGHLAFDSVIHPNTKGKHEMNREKYVRRLKALTTKELVSLKDHLADTGNRRHGQFMLACVTSVLLARAGLAA